MSDKRKYGTLGGTLDELKSGKFLANAKIRSSRRKSRWNLPLLLAVPVWLTLLFASIKIARIVALELLHGHSFSDSLSWPSAIAPFFVYFPLLFGTMLVSMVLVNYAIYLLIPPARRAMDAEDKAFPGTEYATQQPLMLKLALYTYPAAFALAVLGELFL